MSELALRYSRKTPKHEVQVSVPRGAVTRLHLPDDDAKAHLVTALLKVRPQPGEALELFARLAARLEHRRDEVRLGIVVGQVQVRNRAPRHRHLHVMARGLARVAHRKLTHTFAFTRPKNRMPKTT